MGAISVDFAAAERMLSVLPYVAQGQVPPRELLESLVETPAFQLWFQHTNRHRMAGSEEFDEEAYYQIVRQAAAGETKQFLSRWLYRHANRGEQFNEMIRQLKTLQIGTTAYEIANSYLPEPFSGDVNVYFYCATRGSAIVLDNNVVVDIADFPDPSSAPLPIQELQALLSHEIFHMGRSELYARGIIKGFDTDNLSEPLLQVAQVVGMLVEEGSATYFTSMALNDKILGEEWRKLLKSIPDICDRFTDLLMQGLHQQLPAEEVLRQGYSFFGLEGYALGAKMCEAIEVVLGRKSLQQALLQPRTFFVTYNQAVSCGKLDMPLIPQQLAEAVEQMPAKNS